MESEVISAGTIQHFFEQEKAKWALLSPKIADASKHYTQNTLPERISHYRGLKHVLGITDTNKIPFEEKPLTVLPE